MPLLNSIRDPIQIQEDWKKQKQNPLSWGYKHISHF